jgi:excinuclease ABC subunit B
LQQNSLNHFAMFNIHTKYQPAGDQPRAIKQLVEGLERGDKTQVLLGVTGSGKTFTMANVIQQVQRPTLILTHNKTLTAQLYGEFKEYFPDNAVEYFVSYYDYYQPESYIPVTNTFIEKDQLVNEDIDKLRLRATAAMLSGRKDVIIVASVSCIYGMGNPEDYKQGIVHVAVGQKYSRNTFLYDLVHILYNRTEADFVRATFRVKGDSVEVNLPYVDYGLRIVFFGDEIESIETFTVEDGKRLDKLTEAAVFPANLYIAPRERITEILNSIQDEMTAHVKFFESEGKNLEASRIQQRVTFDLEMIRELGYCQGVENYSRFFDGRKPGTRPFCLLDYFPEDFLMFIDESHATLPQVRGMHGGDRARKMNLVQYGFRLPSAMDNRPLNFGEFEQLIPQVVHVSATPGNYEMEQTEGVVVEQVVRPTGLLDPPIEVRACTTQVDDLLYEINIRVKKEERVLVTTLTKRMAEELSKYLIDLNVKCRYIHSDIDAMERVEILRDLRLGEFDVLVGVNLLREGLDLPEVSLVAILDADKEGFLRNDKSLTQTAGRAARNANGIVIMYADKVTDSMRRTIDETNRRRALQIAYNLKHGITPKTIFKSKEQIVKQSSVLDIKGSKKSYAEIGDKPHAIAADPIVQYATKPQLEKQIKETERRMKAAAKDLDFITAAQLRDELFALQQILKDKHI